MGKWYAVKQGKKAGIYTTWAECQKQTKGYSGAVFKSFKTKEEALNYMTKGEKLPDIDSENCALAYVDGSYDDFSKRFASGGVIMYNGDKYEFSKAYDDIELVSMRNVAGEIKAAMLAMEYCIKKDIKFLKIYHDYEGIAKWCLGEWQAKKEGTKAYKKFYEQALKDGLIVEFVKVAAHTGVEYNERADVLAKKALGLA